MNVTEGISPETIYYAAIAIAAVLGLVFGWLLRSNKCSQQVAELQAHIEQDKQQLLFKDQEMEERRRKIVHLTGELAQVRGDAALYESRWRTQLKKSKELEPYRVWIKNLQVKLAHEKTNHTQNRAYARAMAERYAITRDNLTRTHNQLTSLSKRNADFLQWIHVFQSKLKRRNTEYSQLRGYADAMSEKYTTTRENLSRAHNRLTDIAHLEQKWKVWAHVFQSKLKKRNVEYTQLRSYASNTATALQGCKQNLVRVHTRLSEIDGKQQPLKTWIRVFQNKLKQRRTDYEQLRNYADVVGSELAASKKNMRRLHDRLTAVEREADYMRRQVGGVVVAEVPREAVVPDNKPLRMMDRLRLFGTSKSDILGRFSNQIRETRIEAAQKERVLVNSCEEKDAIIADLKSEIKRLENRTQKTSGEVPLDQSVRIRELESALGKLKEETQRIPDMDQLIKEHELTIDAYRYKVSKFPVNDSRSEPVVAKPKVKAKAKSVSKTSQEPDDLKKINGIGPKLEKILNEHGLYTFAQVAALTQKDIDVLSTKLGSFKDRISRDDWIGKARKLHKKKYGNNP